MTSGGRAPGRAALWLAAGAAILAALIAGFVPRPAGLPEGDGLTSSAFAAFASGAIVAIAILPFVVRRGIRSRSVWITASIAALMIGLLSYAGAGYAQRACMAQYDGRPVIGGTRLTELGASYLKLHPETTRDQLIEYAIGMADLVWTRESIDRCRVSVASTYFLWVPFLAVSILAAAQAVPSPGLTASSRTGPPLAAAAAPGLEYDVFISYRHGGRDTEFARHLLTLLEGAGYTAAIDERDFPANASFLQEMERCIRASRYTVAVISARYLGSGNCEEEAIISKVLDMGDRRRRLIPMIIEPVAMPAWLYGIVGIDCTRTDALVEPFDKLTATLGPPLVRVQPS